MAGDKDTPTYSATVNDRMTAIANAIRDKTGGTESLTLVDMASGVNEVYEAGKKAEYNEFWNNFKYGQYAFAGQGWTKATFKPNKDFTVSSYCFLYHSWLRTAYDLAAHLEELGIKMTIGSAGDTQTFREAAFSRLPELDFSACSGMFDRVFYGCEDLVTIDKLILQPEGAVSSFNGVFDGCSKLKNIVFEGVLDKSISFSACPLSVASLKNIISCLKDFSGTDSEFTYKVTFTSACKTALNAEGNTSPNGNTWSQYITDLGWNLG